MHRQLLQKMLHLTDSEFATCSISTVYTVMQCLSVHPSHLCILSKWVNNKHIFKFFSPSGSHSILVFPYWYQTLWQYYDGNPPPSGGIKCRCGRQKLQLLTNIWLWHWWLVTCHQQFQPWAKVYHSCHASVNLVYNRTEFNCTHW